MDVRPRRRVRSRPPRRPARGASPVREYRLRVNGTIRSIRTGSDRIVLSVLREEWRLTGAKYGCGEGQCGACTILLGSEPVPACQLTIGEVGKRELTTIEGLAGKDGLHPVQRAFAELGAFQCGFCTPAMILGTVALLRVHPHPTRAQIEGALDGHLCRCCGYSRIVRSIERAAEQLGAGPGEGR